ncbi:MAG: FxsA family protein [Pseudomonadota bacterium]
MPWLLIFFLTPIAEMYLLIEVAGYIDAWPTIGLVMLTAVIGVALLKRQGLATLTRGMGKLNEGQVPAREMAEGLLLAVAGALLVTPGFITDVVGFTLLFPPSRIWIAQRMLKRVHIQGFAGPTGFDADPRAGPHDPLREGPRPGAPGATEPGVTIEGEYQQRDP